jgi:hypothetical protein
MPNYGNGKIYQIISPNCTEVYIGSTTQPLSVRMAGHRSAMKRGRKCRSCIVIEAGDSYIELIEEFPCENKEQLNKREGEIQREKQCTNLQVPGRTYKEWYIDNRDARTEYAKKYREENKKIISEKRRASRREKKHQILLNQPEKDSTASTQVKEN